ncbi:MAG: XRE family transcriptional regulator [Candidatus Omnitrophica bacterium]|nr:XRE family transcriptional regulator [Candidatus Omnitrophota bacterium]
MDSIGYKVKQLRQEKRLALKELAARTGLTSSFLSQLEKGVTSPSVDSLRRIAEALGTSVAAFFKKDESSEFVFIRRHAPTQIHGRYEILAASVLDLQILPLLLRLHPHEVIPSEHCPEGGEMLGLPTQGRVQVAVNNKEIILEPGDSIYLVRPIFTGIKNLGGKEAAMLWTIMRSMR